MRLRHFVRTWSPTCIAVQLLFFWLCGFLDFFFEEDFSSFRWPPFVNVRHQVARELVSLSPEHLNHNNWEDFKPLVEPSCEKNWLTRRKSLLIIIKTSPSRVERRNAYRKTLSTVHKMGDYRVKTIFVMGNYYDVSYTKSPLLPEANVYNDMLVGNFQDDYFNNTYKFMHSLKLARWHCVQNSSISPYVLMMDDDYMLNLNGIISIIDKHSPNEELYMGYRFDSSPFRSVFNKYRISLKEYPYNLYPPYCAAGFVLYTPQSVKEFYAAAQHLKLFRFDDVYAGMIAYFLGLEVQMNTNFVFERDDSIPWTIKISEHGHSSQEIIDNFFPINGLNQTH